MRPKTKCKGLNSNGEPCNNWAIKNSMYCHVHQNQITEDDIKNEKWANKITSIILLIIAIIYIIIKFACSEY